MTEKYVDPLPNPTFIEPDIAMPVHLDGYQPLGAIAVLAEEGIVEARFLSEYYRDFAVTMEAFDPDRADDYHELADQAFELGKTDENIPNPLLQEIREKLLSYTGEDLDILKDYLHMHIPTSFLALQEAAEEFENVERRKRGEEDVQHETDIVRWLAIAPDRQLLNFLQWHNRRIEELNRDPATRERIIAEKQRFLALVAQAVSRKDLPETALSYLSTVDAISTFIGDIFALELNGLDGYYNPEYEHNVLIEDYPAGIHFHELTHAVIGEMASSIFDEAMVTHIRLCLEYGNFLVMDPDLRDDEGEFEHRRKLMSDVLTLGLLGNLVPDAILAFCTYNTESPEYDAYLDKLLMSYDGLRIADFIDAQMIEANHLVDAGIETGYDNNEHYALMYADEGVIYLASILGGKTDEQIVAAHIAKIEADDISPDLSQEQLKKQIAEAETRLVKIREYIEDARRVAA
jgi:hypothetical protein